MNANNNITTSAWIGKETGSSGTEYEIVSLKKQDVIKHWKFDGDKTGEDAFNHYVNMSLEPLIKVNDVINGGTIEHNNASYRIQAHRLCDHCKDETQILNIADGLRLCPECLNLLEQSETGKKKMQEIQADNLGVDIEEVEDV